MLLHVSTEVAWIGLIIASTIATQWLLEATDSKDRSTLQSGGCRRRPCCIGQQYANAKPPQSYCSNDLGASVYFKSSEYTYEVSLQYHTRRVIHTQTRGKRGYWRVTDSAEKYRY